MRSYLMSNEQDNVRESFFSAASSNWEVYSEFVDNLLSNPPTEDLEDLVFTFMTGRADPSQDMKDKLVENTPILYMNRLRLSQVHAAIGVGGEALELLIAKEGDDVNIKEELGDILFYSTALILIHMIMNPNHCKHPYEAVDMYITSVHKAAIDQKQTNFSVTLKHVADSANDILDYVKKYVFYKQVRTKDGSQTIPMAILEKISELLIRMHQLYPLQELRSSNVAKLSKRYPTGRFSTEYATQRLDKECQEG